VNRCEVVVLEFASFGEGGISRVFCFDVLGAVQRVQRADEQTRTAYPFSLRVIIYVLHGYAQACQTRITKPISFLCLAPCYTVLRSRWYQSGIRSSSGAEKRSRFIVMGVMTAILARKPPTYAFRW
jgi:hypothetical protein